ncbi:MAG: rhodanese-like domain-containing protein [Candidatus Rokubacteria bacterium]|nr:rhodanese-like domain-containing protein [Candidatus Rokubacteria bacterium]
MPRSKTVFWRCAMAVVMVLVAAVVVFAQDAPAIPKEVTVVNAEQLKKMLDGKEKFLLVDSRNGSEYREGYIPTAVSVYDKEMEAHKAKFPADKSYPIVFYCNGYPKCPRSLNGAKMAMGWGYKKLYLYAAGFPDWAGKGYPVERQ